MSTALDAMVQNTDAPPTNPGGNTPPNGSQVSIPADTPPIPNAGQPSPNDISNPSGDGAQPPSEKPLWYEDAVANLVNAEAGDDVRENAKNGIINQFQHLYKQVEGHKEELGRYKEAAEAFSVWNRTFESNPQLMVQKLLKRIEDVHGLSANEVLGMTGNQPASPATSQTPQAPPSPLAIDTSQWSETIGEDATKLITDALSKQQAFYESQLAALREEAKKQALPPDAQQAIQHYQQQQQADQKQQQLVNEVNQQYNEAYQRAYTEFDGFTVTPKMALEAKTAYPSLTVFEAIQQKFFKQIHGHLTKQSAPPANQPSPTPSGTQHRPGGQNSLLNAEGTKLMDFDAALDRLIGAS